MTKVFNEFISRITSEFNVQKVTVYSYDGTDTAHILGERFTDTALEQFMSYYGTAVVKSRSSSRLISRISAKDTVYLIILDSKSAETFHETDVRFIIADLQKLERRLHNEYCSSGG